jgi:DNA-binding LytR/AlgR family response regulator
MTSNKIRTLIVENEQHIRQELSNALEETTEFIIIGECASVDEGYNMIKKLLPDLVFLDIKIEGGLSFQIINRLMKEKFEIPPIVINTGFRDYDYAKKIHNDYGDKVIYILNKPFWENWIQHQERILDAYIQSQQKSIEDAQNTPSKFINVQSGRKSFQILPSDIILVTTGEKTKGNSMILFSSHSIDTGLSLTQLLQKLPSKIKQVNRYEAINIDWISYLDHSEKEVLLRNGTKVPVGDSFYDSLIKALE